MATSILLALVIALWLWSFYRRLREEERGYKRDEALLPIQWKVLQELANRIGYIVLDENNSTQSVSFTNLKDIAPHCDPQTATVALDGIPLRGRYLNDVVSSKDGQFLLLARLAEGCAPYSQAVDLKVRSFGSAFASVLIDLHKGKVFESRSVEEIMYPTATDGNVVFYHCAGHNRSVKFARILRLSDDDFVEIGTLQDIQVRT